MTMLTNLVRAAAPMVVAMALVAPTASLANADADSAGARIAEQLDDPARQDAIAGVMEAMTRMMLSMPVGPLAEAVRQIDPDADIADLPRDARVADLTRSDPEAMPAQVRDVSRGAISAMAIMARQMGAMEPVLRDMARDMAAQWERGSRRSR